MINLILFGPPGSGKGTQAKMLEEKYNLVHVSTGDLFRYEMGNDTPLGIEAKNYIKKGALVPDEITIGMLKNKVESAESPEGFIFDGFPRTIPQAEALDQYLAEKGEKISALISLDVDKEEIIQRILKRGETSGRPDDQNKEIIENRIKVYLDETKPVYEFYNCKEVAQMVNGLGSIDDIFTRLSSAIDQL